MDRNKTTKRIGRRVSVAIRQAGFDVHTVAQAVDITTPELNARLEGDVEFQIGELVDVGGFLRAPVNNFLGGAA